MRRWFQTWPSSHNHEEHDCAQRCFRCSLNRYRIRSKRRVIFTCNTHGDFNPLHQWGCPDCVSLLRRENETLRRTSKWLPEVQSREALLKINAGLREKIEELEQTFDLRWKADMRAIKIWRAEDTAARELIMPDHADMVIWLLNKYYALSGALQDLARSVKQIPMLTDGSPYCQCCSRLFSDHADDCAFRQAQIILERSKHA